MMFELVAQGLWGGSWWADDKLYHFLISAVVSAMIYVGARSLGWRRRVGITLAVLGVLLAGTGKELLDEYLGEVYTVEQKFFSLKDMIWNAAGLLVGGGAAVWWRHRR